MAGLHNQIAAGIEADAAAVAGISQHSPVPVDNIPSTPFAVVGPPKGTMVAPGAWEVMSLQYPLRIYYARNTSDLDQTALNDFVDLFIAQFRLGVTLAVAGVVAAQLTTWDTGKFYDVNGSTFQAIDFTVSVEVARAATYTP